MRGLLFSVAFSIWPFPREGLVCVQLRMNLKLVSLTFCVPHCVCADKKKTSSAIQTLSFRKLCQTLLQAPGEEHVPWQVLLLCKKNYSNFVCKESLECNRKLS